MQHRDTMSKAHEAVKMGTHIAYPDGPVSPKSGYWFMEMHDAKSGELMERREAKNIITEDAGILMAILSRDPDSRSNGINMLAVGTGAAGSLLSPDAPDSDFRRLNAEIARKTFTSTIFRNSGGSAVAYPTNIVDYTCQFGEAEAVGPLNEMGLMSTISDNPLTLNLNPDIYPARDVTRDLTTYDILVNYLTFPVCSKPSTAILTITWRLSY